MTRTALLGLSLTILVLAASPNGAFAQDGRGMMQRAKEDSTFSWESLSSDGVEIYYLKDSFAERHRAVLLRSVPVAVREALDCLGEPGYDRIIRVFYLRSREEMERIVGRPYSGFANWSESCVFVVCNAEWRSFEKHEITHVLTMELWGEANPSSGWMIEGIPVYCDGWCREYSVDEMAYHFLSKEDLPQLSALFDDPRALGEIRGGFYAASIIGFIRDNYGANTLRGLWLEGPESLRELTGVDASKLFMLWKKYLESTVDRDIDVDIDTVNELGCG